MMSSIMSKQLGDFLQEQQEPFILEVYLHERGCSSSNVGTCLKRSVSSGLKRNRKFIPNCSKIVRALFSRILIATDNQKVGSNSGIRGKIVSDSEPEADSSKQELVDHDKFSSSSSATMFNSCSESDGEDAQYSSRKDAILAIPKYYQATKDENEVSADRRFRLESAKDSKQLSPVSVLEHTELADDSPYCKKNDDARRIHTQFSTSVCAYKSEKLCCSSVREFAKSDVSSQYAKNKKAVQETKQLLFDCVREVVEKHKKDCSAGQQIPQTLGPEKLWELIGQNIWLWSKESINETNTTDLLHLDMLASAQEWSNFEHYMQEIGMQLADAILEDISNEIITDMIQNSSILVDFFKRVD